MNYRENEKAVGWDCGCRMTWEPGGVPTFIYCEVHSSSLTMLSEDAVATTHDCCGQSAAVTHGAPVSVHEPPAHVSRAHGEVGLIPGTTSQNKPSMLQTLGAQIP